ncbi:hypothetical protein Tco_0924559 [Tanacetum coccineum]|uniref:ELMO domain-containing protein n=1 Tax=Tanacetum coccineum TaxID=301880 RepID=A0ABQ5D4A3_9ASTR
MAWIIPSLEAARDDYGLIRNPSYQHPLVRRSKSLILLELLKPNLEDLFFDTNKGNLREKQYQTDFFVLARSESHMQQNCVNDLDVVWQHIIRVLTSSSLYTGLLHFADLPWFDPAEGFSFAFLFLIHVFEEALFRSNSSRATICPVDLMEASRASILVKYAECRSRILRLHHLLKGHEWSDFTEERDVGDVVASVVIGGMIDHSGLGMSIHVRSDLALRPSEERSALIVNALYKFVFFKYHLKMWKDRNLLQHL